MTPINIMWIVFTVTAISLFLADLKISARGDHEISSGGAFILCGFWVTVATLFGFLTGHMLGFEKMVEFFTAYVIEYSLSMDNMFVFLIIFSYFGIPPKTSRRSLHGAFSGQSLCALSLYLPGSSCLTLSTG